MESPLPEKPLLIDLYELTMAEAYWRSGHTGRASFSLFVRGYPPSRSYYVASGIDESLDFLAQFKFDGADIESLRSLGRFDKGFLEFLSSVRFTGDARSVREGTVVFANEPIIELDAPIIEGQLVETALLNLITIHTNLSSKAARIVGSARGRPVVDFSARRTHGADAAMTAARASWLAGFSGTSHVGAAARYAIPAVGTMAHSFIQSYESELDAFRAYATSFPDSTVLLVDTWDVPTGVDNAITVASELGQKGHRLAGIRIDSGDLLELSRMARSKLNAAALDDVKITASGGLDEFKIRDLLNDDAPIDNFGVGTAFGVAQDAPHIDTAYKLVEYKGRAVHKTSTGKETLPGRKQVWRKTTVNGTFASDAIAFADEELPGSLTPLLAKSMSNGSRVDNEINSLAAARSRCKDQLARLSAPLLELEPIARFEVGLGGRLARDRVT